MKCQSCDCLVSSDFKYAFTTNCCPKCGKKIMHKDVQELCLKMQNVLNEEGNDIGDLAAWFVNSYLPTIASNNTNENLSQNIVDNSDKQLDNIEVEDKSEKVLKSELKTEPVNKLIDQDRVNMFAKRAGVDKIKFKNLVKNIQGIVEPEELIDQVSMQDNIDGEGLSDADVQEVSEFFTVPSNNIDITEIKKIQRLEQMATTGSVGIIRRSS